MIRPTARALMVPLVAWPLIVGGATSAGPPNRQVPRWGELVDPSRDCKVAPGPAGDGLTISVPGTPHLLSAELDRLPLAAPRVVRPVAGDFRATVRVGGRLDPGPARSSVYSPYHGAGLLVWKDRQNYLRLERAVGEVGGRAMPYLNFELRSRGRLSFSRGIPIEDRPAHLRVGRVGGQIRAWHSPDGERWSELAGPPTPLAGPVEVGVVAVNSSRRLLVAELGSLEVEAGEPASASPLPPAPTDPTSKPADAFGP